MYFHFLIEDRSSTVLIEILMEKIINSSNADTVTFECTSFKGLGGFTPKNMTHETRTGCLLNDLATYLCGLDKSLRYMPSCIVVVLDNDKRDTQDFRNKLEEVAAAKGISTDHVFCIAVEEMEAWLLGDETALFSAYPSAKRQIFRTYQQDSICGTWEKLADVVYPGGLAKMKKECPTYVEVGRQKSEWAKQIGPYMDLGKNISPSFQYFVGEIKRRLAN